MKPVIIILSFIISSLCCRSQTITTFAGGASIDIDGVPATASRIDDPVGGTFDKFGNYYFASCLSGNKVRKVSTSGVITSVAGTGIGAYSGDGGLATAAALKGPFSVQFDTSGNMYICDGLNYRIRKVSASTGIISTIAGTGVAGYNGDNIPATSAKINGAFICLDKAGNIYLAEYNNRRVRKISTAGVITTIAGTGAIGSSGDGGPATNAMLSPNNITIDNVGNLYIPDPYASVVRKINTSGIISTVAGNGTVAYSGIDGIPATNASFQPAHITCDYLNNLYVADKYNGRVFKITNTGMFYHVAGNGITGFSGDGGPATAASFNYPSGVSTDMCGNLYITEPTNGRIRKVTFNPNPLPCVYLNVNEQAQNYISIYPNPANDELTIEGVLPGAAYTLCNLVGTAVQQGVLGQISNKVSLHSLSPGIYMMQLTTADGIRTTQKVIKK